MSLLPLLLRGVHIGFVVVLTELYLSGNDLGDGIQLLAKSLQYNKHLSALGIFVHHCRGAREFPLLTISLSSARCGFE